VSARCWPPQDASVACWCGKSTLVPAPPPAGSVRPPHVVCHARGHINFVRHEGPHAGAVWERIKGGHTDGEYHATAAAKACEARG
jgi:hypothetical protein